MDHAAVFANGYMDPGNAPGVPVHGRALHRPGVLAFGACPGCPAVVYVATGGIGIVAWD